MSQEKFLFLDVDGCLNSLSSLYERLAEVAGIEFRYEVFTDITKKEEYAEHTAEIHDAITKMRDNGEHVPRMSMENYPFNKNAIQHLNEIVDVSGCKVVLSSTWRLTTGLRGTEKKLQENGYKYTLYDKTPSNLNNSQRGNEIAHWLKWNGYLESNPKIAILDDDWQDIYGWFPDHLVVTTFKLGLTHKEKDKVLSLLL